MKKYTTTLVIRQIQYWQLCQQNTWQQYWQYVEYNTWQLWMAKIRKIDNSKCDKDLEKLGFSCTAH